MGAGQDAGGSLRTSGCEFHLLVEDKVTGVFFSMSGGEITVNTIQHDVVFESGASTTLQIPSTTSFGDIKLYRGFANYVELYSWLKCASDGDIIRARRNGTVQMKKWAVQADVDKGLADAVGDWIVGVQWHFYNAWPTKLASFGSFMNEGTTTKVARVELTLAVESIEYERYGS
jgi:phage tail-like protein